MKQTFFLKGMFFLLAPLALTVTGCLKDKLADSGGAGFTINNNEKIAELPGGTVVFSLESGSVDTSFNLVKVRIATDKPVAADTKVKLEMNPGLVTAYNTANGTSYVTPSPALYQFDNLTVTVPAGSRDGHLKIKVKPNDLIGTAYAFGFSIVSATDPAVKISANFKDQVIVLGVKNRYDGVYDLRVRTVGWAAYGIADDVTGDYPATFDLITAGGNSVTSFNNGRGDFLLPAFTGGAGLLGAPTAFGATTPLFVFDNATNKLTDVRNTTPDDGRGRFLLMNPAVTDSRYDPAGRKIYAAFIMKQNGRPDQLVYDTLTYLGPR